MIRSSTIRDNERAARGSTLPWSQVRGSLKLDAAGLIPAIAQQHDTGEVLMMAWMNLEAIDETLATGRVCYYSRSRSRLWRKGETSGQVQHLREMRIDCDGDTLLLLVEQKGPACHTGRASCFYNRIDGDVVEVVSDPLIDPDKLYEGRGDT